MTEDEHGVLATLYPGEELKRQRARVRAAGSLVRRAGSSRDLLAAERRVEAAEQAVRVRLPELREQIAIPARATVEPPGELLLVQLEAMSELCQEPGLLQSALWLRRT